MSAVPFPWKQNRVGRDYLKHIQGGALGGVPVGCGCTPSGIAGLGKTFGVLGRVNPLPQPDSYYLGSVNGLGELTSEMLAAQIQARTGRPTRGIDIIRRTISAGIQDAASTGDERYKALSALANGFATRDLGATAALSAIRTIQPMLPRGLNDVINLSVVIGQLGATDGVVRAGLNLGRELLSSVGNIISGAIGEEILAAIGGAEIWRTIADTAGVIADAVKTCIPFVSAAARLAFAISDLVMSYMPAEHGGTVSAAEWGKDACEIYTKLCAAMGTPIPEGGMSYDYNPWFQELFVRANGSGALVLHRAVECKNYGLPDWRTVWSSDQALSWIFDGKISGTKYVVQRYDGETVLGSMTAGFGGGEMMAPFRWSTDRPAFRAAAVIASYIGTTIGNLRGVGTWQSGCRGAVERDADDPWCYDDTSEFYTLGYGAQMRSLSEGPVPVPPSEFGPWLIAHGYNPGWVVGWRSGGFAIILPTHGFPDQSRGGRMRDGFSRWLHPLIPGSGMTLAEIPRNLIPRVGGPVSPGSQKSRTAPTSTGIPTVAIVGGLGLAAVAAWLALK